MRDLEQYAIQCMEELEAIGIEYGNIIDVKPNTRAMKRWGQCRSDPDGYRININTVFLDERNSEQGLKETIIHELLHSCKGCMNHGKTWKQLAAKVNSAYGYNIKRCSSAEEKGVLKETTVSEKKDAPKKTNVAHIPSSKRVAECVECGYTYTGAGMSRVVRQIKHYRCFCGGKLRLLDPVCTDAP